MICPIRKDTNCAEEDCAWYLPASEMCAVFAIAVNLQEESGSDDDNY